MSKRKYRLDVCPECKVREQISSVKRLYQCRYCERWFCGRHLEPKLAVFKDLNVLIKDVEWRDAVEKDWQREDGHPDYAYTKERFEELKIEKAIIGAKLEAFLDRSRAYRKEAPKRRYPIAKIIPIYCPNCGSDRTMTTAYRKESETFECLSCHHSWKEPRSIEPEAYQEISSKDQKKEKSRETKWWQ